MSSKMLGIFCLLFTVLESVFGTTCTDSATCIVSTHTTGVCDSTSNVCACDSSSAAIRTGCGSKLTKPTIAQPPGYSTVMLEGKSATLTCSSPDGATLFEWSFKGSVINGANASTYTIAAASTSDVGIYKCKAKISENSNLDSDLSDPLQIDILLKTDMNLANGPTVFLSTTKVFTRKTVNVSCINIPMGYDPAKVIIAGNTLLPAMSPLRMDGLNEGKYVSCDLTDTPTSHDNYIQGVETYLPTIVYDISAPTTISTTALNNGVYTKDAPITFICMTTPNIDYVDTRIVTIIWSWLIERDSSVIPGAGTQTYELPQYEGSYTLKCRVATTKGSTFESDPITIVRNSTYVTKPVIIADPTIPVVGSRLSLACGSEVFGATYSWKKDGTDIARHFEHIIQLDILTISDNGAYECTVKRSMVTQTSDSFTVNVSVLESDFRATCHTYNNTCVPTTNTLATCANKVCGCKNSTVANSYWMWNHFGLSSLKQDIGSLTLKAKTDTISQLVRKLSTTSLFTGKSVTFKCDNIPIGYNTSI